MRPVLVDLWPIYRVRITTPRLQLRLPTESELAELADVAGKGVHNPTERPFLTPWTEGGPLDRARFVLREHWANLAGWADDRWALDLGVYTRDNQPLGMASIRARDFAVVREVTTSSRTAAASRPLRSRQPSARTPKRAVISGLLPSDRKEPPACPTGRPTTE